MAQSPLATPLRPGNVEKNGEASTHTVRNIKTQGSLTGPDIPGQREDRVVPEIIYARTEGILLAFRVFARMLMLHLVVPSTFT